VIFNTDHANKTCGLVIFPLAIRLVVWVYGQSGNHWVLEVLN